MLEQVYWEPHNKANRLELLKKLEDQIRIDLLIKVLSKAEEDSIKVSQLRWQVIELTNNQRR